MAFIFAALTSVSMILPVSAIAAGKIEISVIPSNATVDVGDTVSFIVHMGDATGTNFCAFSAKISLPDNLALVVSSGKLAPNFMAATGIAVAEFDETPILMVSGFGDGAYNGGALDIASFSCEAMASGVSNVTLTDVEFLDVEVNAIPTSVTPASVSVGGNAQANVQQDGQTQGTSPPVTSDSPAPTPAPAPDDGEPSEPSAPSGTITKSPATAAGFTVTLTKTRDYAGVTFADIAGDAWYATTVRFAYEYGLFNGTGEGQFSPNGTATRAQIITVLARAAGFDTDGGASWYDKAVAWAVANGISDGTNLDGNVTREQLATLLWRFAGEPEAAGGVDFTDAGDISEWAETAMAWAVSAGIINGYPGGGVNSGGSATRAEVAAMIERYVVS
jgi:hypothetical protein